MIKTEPTVHLIMRPQIDWDAIEGYLMSVGGLEWLDRIEQPSNDGERLVEFAGRLCYRSWSPGLNPNVTKIRTDPAVYLENILRSGHGSVLEHASYSFVLQNVSRVFSHELVRHHAGTSFSQESLRFVRLQEIPFRIPDELFSGLNLAQKEQLETAAIKLVEHMEDFQKSAAEVLRLDSGDVSFTTKKHATSAMRRLAPEGVSTTIMFTANIRALRHIIEMRTAPGAEEEMRLVFKQVAEIMQKECPLLFGDYLVRDDGTFEGPFRKV